MKMYRLAFVQVKDQIKMIHLRPRPSNPVIRINVFKGHIDLNFKAHDVRTIMFVSFSYHET